MAVSQNATFNLLVYVNVLYPGMYVFVPLNIYCLCVSVCVVEKVGKRGPMKTQADEGKTPLLILCPAHIPGHKGRSLYDPRAPHTRCINRRMRVQLKIWIRPD